MITGHGDDAYKYGRKITINFSSNVYNHISHNGLRDYLYDRMDCIRNYPEPEPYTLEKALACRLHLPEQEVCVTNGATEAIYLIAQAFKGLNSSILMPTFSEYADACRLHGHKIYPAYTLAAPSEKTNLMWICNPNNPTGIVQEKEILESFIKRYPKCLFIIDQSYEYFTLKTLFTAKEAALYPNVILLHSMTKRFAVPGLRLGYMTGNEFLLKSIRLQRMPWSVNQLAIEAGHYLLQESGQYEIDIPLLMKEKARLAEALIAIGGIEVWDSDTHYMLVRLRMGRASALKAFLAEECGILIRDASNFEGLDEHFFRIATQSPKENDELVDCIKRWTYLY